MMKERRELELILELIGKYDLPLSPILEYAIKEKMEEYPEANDEKPEAFLEYAAKEKMEEYPEANDEKPEANIGTSIETEQPTNIYKTSLNHLIDIDDNIKWPYDKSEYRIENHTNQCFIINKLGKRIYSSSGRLVVLSGVLFRVYYTFSSISLNIIKKDEDKDRFRLCERIIYARYRTPLHDSLDKKNYYVHINAVKFDSITNNFVIRSGNKWYDNSGYYIGSEKDEKNTIEETPIEGSPAKSSNELRIVDFGERTIAVIGETKPHKDTLKAMGGYFMIHTKLGPVWTFPNKKREKVQAYIDGDTSVVDRQEGKDKEEFQKKTSSRYIIRVICPNGKEFCSNFVWKTLVDVVIYAGAERVKKLNIICMGDNLVSSRLNSNKIYRTGQKDIGKGLYVCTFSSTDVKYKQIEIINKELRLGLKIDKLYVGKNGNVQANENNESNSIDEFKTVNSFKMSKPLNKRRFVLETVKRYVHLHPQVTYGGLLRVFHDSLNNNKANGVVRRYDDIKIKIKINPRTQNYFFLKDDDIIQLSNGVKIVVNNQWGDDFERFLKVAEHLFHVIHEGKGYLLDISTINEERGHKDIQEGTKVDKRIGYIVRLFPSQKKGEIINVRVDHKGIKKLVVKTVNGDIVEVDDLPYLYEILKR